MQEVLKPSFLLQLDFSRLWRDLHSLFSQNQEQFDCVFGCFFLALWLWVDLLMAGLGNPLRQFHVLYTLALHGLAPILFLRLFFRERLCLPEVFIHYLSLTLFLLSFTDLAWFLFYGYDPWNPWGGWVFAVDMKMPSYIMFPLKFFPAYTVNLLSWNRGWFKGWKPRRRVFQGIVLFLVIATFLSFK